MLSILLNAIPELANLIPAGKGKDLVSIGAKVAKEVLGTDDPSAISAALDDPKNLEAFRARLEQETAQLLANLADVQDARRQTVELVKSGSAVAWAPVVISTLIVVGFLSLTTGLLFKAVPDSQVAMVLFGALSAGFTQVLNYWLGSSAGSKRSGDAVRAIAESVAPILPKAKR